MGELETYDTPSDGESRSADLTTTSSYMSRSIPTGANVIFIDGQCIFCNHMVSFILAHDPRGLFHFAHLQGALAKDVLRRYARQTTDIDSVYVLVGAGTQDEHLFWDGKAARAIWPRLFWFAAFVKWVPLRVLNFCYRAFAKRRYRLFGKYEVCHVPAPKERARFLDESELPPVTQLPTPAEH
jgi:predicted DCC family thiol-disulfide oxidoreductase YuxK